MKSSDECLKTYAENTQRGKSIEATDLVEDLLTDPHSHLGVSSFSPCCLLSVPLIEGGLSLNMRKDKALGDQKGVRKGDRGGNEPPLTLLWNQDRGETGGYFSPRFPWNLCLCFDDNKHTVLAL